MNNKRIKTFIFMFFASVLSKVLGLVRSIVFANYFGTGYEATAFFTASRIPLQLLDIFLLSAVTSVFIPIYTKIEENEGKDNALKFTNNFTNIVAFIAFIISLIGILFAPYIVKMIAGGLDSNTFSLTVNLIRILFPMIIFSTIAFAFVAFLQANFEFNIPNLISSLSNFILILYLIIFGSDYGIYGVAIAMLFAWLSQVLIQVPSVIKHKYKFKFILDFKDKKMIETFKLAIPIMLVSFVTPVNNMVNMRISSGLNNGHAVSAIEYSYSLYLIAGGVFAYAVANLIFPELSKLNIKNNKIKYKKLINKALDSIIIYSIPLTIFIMITGEQIIKLLYERGEFTSYSTSLTSSALFFYSLAIIAFSINEVMHKCYYSLQDTKTPFFTGIVSIFVNVILSVNLAKYIGVSGIALAYTVATIINSLLLVFIFNKRIKGIFNSKLVIQTLKTIISSIIMGLVLIIVNKFFMTFSNNLFGQFLVLVFDVILSVIIYIIISILLKNETIILTLNYLKNKVVNFRSGSGNESN